MNTRSFFLIFLFCSASLFSAVQDHFVKPTADKSGPHQMRNIDFIYAINLDHRPEKFADINAQLNPYGIYPYRFPGIYGVKLPIETFNDVGLKYDPSWMRSGIMGTYHYLDEKGEFKHQHELIHDPSRTYFCHCMARAPVAIALTHLSVLQDAYDSGYETIWVLEDDILVLKNPHILSTLIDKLDALLGKKGWDILFTDLDTKNKKGEHIPCFGHAYRPNFVPADPYQFPYRANISPDFRIVGARYGAYSMIVRRSGMKKILDFIKQYSIFLPYDMDYTLPPGIRLITVLDEVVSTRPVALSDNN